MLAATGLDVMTVVEGRHYLQEEAAPQIAAAVRRLPATDAATGHGDHPIGGSRRARSGI